MMNIWDKPDLLVLSGSNLYGCSTPESDIDMRGFVVEPGEYLLNREKFEQFEDKGTDTVIWSFTKFFELIEKGSPNTMEILFAPESDFLKLTKKGRLLVENRHLFISRATTNQIFGFASGEWLKAQLLTKNKETGEIYHSPRVVGAKRKDSHAQHGYSVKNAYHSIRLLEQGIELLETGTLTFPRPNANLLLSIRNGEMNFEELSELVEDRSVEFKVAEQKTSLIERPDKKKLDDLYFRVIEDSILTFFSRRTNDRTV